MDEKIEIYNKYSHKLAFKQLVERFCFEIEASEKIFNGDKVTLEQLKRDSRNLEVFDDSEYREAFKISKELKKNITFID